MPTLRMIPEDVRSTGDVIRATGGEVYDIATTVQQSWSQLASSWSGGGRDAFDGDINTVINQLHDLADQADMLGTRVKFKADEWEGVDRRGAQLLAGLVAGLAILIQPISGVVGTGLSLLSNGFDAVSGWFSGVTNATRDFFGGIFGRLRGSDGTQPDTQEAASQPTQSVPPAESEASSQPDPIALKETSASGKQCAVYARERRPDLGRAGGDDGGAANYITKLRDWIVSIGDKDDLKGKIAQGYAIVWPRQHSQLKGTDGYTYGHIAIVESVDVDKITVSQANWPGKPTMEITRDELQSLYIIGPTE